MKKCFLTALALLCAFALVLAGCGAKTPAQAPAEETGEAPALGVKEYALSASTWSSPNGATVHLTATPFGYAEGYSASFVVMLGEEEVANEPCVWDGSAYTASAELNAADGLRYCVYMTAADGNTASIPLLDAGEAYVNLAASLESYCHVLVEASEFAEETLTLTAGSVQIQTPRISNNGETVSIQEAALELTFQGETVDSQTLPLSGTAPDGYYELFVTGTSFRVPDMENDQQLMLMLKVTLSNGQILQSAGGTFFYNDGELLTAVG